MGLQRVGHVWVTELNWTCCAKACEFDWSHLFIFVYSVQFSSVAQLCPTLCNPMECSTPGFPVHHQLPELVQTHVHPIDDAIQPPYPLLSPSPAFNLSQHQGSFPVSQHFTSGGQSIGASPLASVLPVNSQDWFPKGNDRLVGSPCSPRNFQESSPTPRFKSINSEDR